MAVVRGPLFSVQATGIFDNAIAFRQRGAVSIAAGLPRVSSPSTPAQAAHDAAVLCMLAGWRSLTPAEKETWATAAVPQNMNGYQWYFRQWFAQAVACGNQPTP